MCPSPVLKRVLMLAVLALAISPGVRAAEWGWSVHYGTPYVGVGHYRYGDPYWSGRWRYPWYPSHWRSYRWRDWGSPYPYAYRYPYRYPSLPRIAPAKPRVVTLPVDTTIRQEQTPRGSRASLPANARLIRTDQGTRYQWQGACYRYDYLSDRYQAVPCP